MELVDLVNDNTTLIERHLSPSMITVLNMMYAVKEVYNLDEPNAVLAHVKTNVMDGTFSGADFFAFTIVVGEDLEYVKQLFTMYDIDALNIILKHQRGKV